MNCSLTAINSNTLQLRGELDMDQLAVLIESGEKFIIQNAGKTLYIDLANWGHAKSTVLSLLLTWLRMAKKHQVKLVYLHPSVALIGLAQVSSLDKLLFAEALAAA